jgi:hypothetical protein
MTSTRDFKQTVVERVERDPAFAKGRCWTKLHRYSSVVNPIPHA